MPMNYLLDQSSAREMAPAPLRYGALTQMAPSNARRPSFDGVTISVHWATAFLVLALFVSAWSHALAEARHSDVTPVLQQIHRSLGVTIWVVTALRIGWRLTRASLPPFPTQMTRLHRAAVKLSEYGLYVLLLGQPATGLLATLFGGRPFTLFLWQFPALVPRDEMLRAVFHLSHELGAWALAALAVSHAAVALFHHFVLRDDVLECMAPVMQRHVPSRSSQPASSFRHAPDTSRISISQSST
jgi:cytochrome b561